MHLLVPFASDDSEACRHVLRDLALPNLSRLLGRLEPAARDDGAADTFSPPHDESDPTRFSESSTDGRRGGVTARWSAPRFLLEECR